MTSTKPDGNRQDRVKSVDIGLPRALDEMRRWFASLSTSQGAMIIAQDTEALAALCRQTSQHFREYLLSRPFHRVAVREFTRDLIRAGLLKFLEGTCELEHVLQQWKAAESFTIRYLIQLEGVQFTQPCTQIRISPRCILRNISEDEWRGMNSPLIDESIRPELIQEYAFLEFDAVLEPNRFIVIEGDGPPQDVRPRSAIDAAIPEILTLALSGIGSFRPGARLAVCDGWSIEMWGSFNGTFLDSGSWVPAPREETRIRQSRAVELQAIIEGTFVSYQRALAVGRRLCSAADRFLRAHFTLSALQLTLTWEQNESCIFELTRVVDSAMSRGRHTPVSERWDRFFDVIEQIHRSPVDSSEQQLFKAARNAIAHGDIIDKLPDVYWLERVVRRFLRAYLCLTSEVLAEFDERDRALPSEEFEEKVIKRVHVALDQPLPDTVLRLARNAERMEEPRHFGESRERRPR